LPPELLPDPPAFEEDEDAVALDEEAAGLLEELELEELELPPGNTTG